MLRPYGLWSEGLSLRFLRQWVEEILEKLVRADGIGLTYENENTKTSPFGKAQGDDAPRVSLSDRRSQFMTSPL